MPPATPALLRSPRASARAPPSPSARARPRGRRPPRGASASSPPAATRGADAPSSSHRAPSSSRADVSAEARAAAAAFDARWRSSPSARAIITGESSAASSAPPTRPPPRRRPGYQPTASDAARAAAAAHPSAALFDDPAWRAAKVEALYPIIAPALTPRGTVASADSRRDPASAADALFAHPAALADADARSCARNLVRLREAGGDAADLVGPLVSNPAPLFAPAPPDGGPRRGKKAHHGDDEAVAESRKQKRDAAARAVRTATSRLAARVSDDGASAARRAGDGRLEGKYRVGGTLKGTSTRAGDLVVRFWNLWGGSSACRAAVTSSPRGSIYRDPARMEAAVLRLDRYAPFVDAPMLLHRAPALLERDAEAIVRDLAWMKRPDVLGGGDVARLCELAPGLLLATREEIRAALEGAGGGGEGNACGYAEARRLCEEGGAASFLARGETGRKKVVPVTERANVHFARAETTKT